MRAGLDPVVQPFVEMFQMVANPAALEWMSIVWELDSRAEFVCSFDSHLLTVGGRLLWVY